ncbi:Predicted arabinose efflux permease, MFS family [Rhizobium sp. RU35A]|uniref:MFS transporter n=1 Tax=Rhizobium sp. RU35A TaxID=1907414 RepID=UPI0009566E16|nr:MFS transporter [Rhizobium sp. RU35A]SIQ29985.1 Predicted arabinose efflux permease, MFS family [Rhizobium sp. RU35A]
MSHVTSITRSAGSKQGLIIQFASSLTIMGSVMIAPMLPKITAEFAATDPGSVDLIPLIVAAPALAIALFAPIAGVLADVLGRKRMLLIGCLLYALFGALPAVIGDIKLIVLSRLLFGCAEAIIMTCCTTLIADYWAPADRMRYINRQVITIGVVGALFFVIGGIAGEGSWRTPFFLYLAPLLIIPAVIAWLWEPDRRGEEASAPKRPQQKIASTIAGSYFLIFAGMVTCFVVTVQTPTVLVGLGVTSTSLIGAAAGLAILCTLLGSIAWPFFRDRIGVARVNACLLWFMACGLFVLSLAPSYPVVLVAMVLQGFGAGFLVSNASLPLLMKLPAGLRARGIGGFTSCLYLGQFASPLIVAAIAAPFGGIPAGLAAAIVIWGVVTALMALAWLFVGASKSREPAQTGNG